MNKKEGRRGRVAGTILEGRRDYRNKNLKLKS
jgi:hypothetical protein